MDFDTAKENIQPLAGGRNVRLLEAALSAETHYEVLVGLRQQRQDFEEKIKNYSGNDPLQGWFDYILWIEQSYPSGGKESGLEEVLQKCLVTFEGNERYKQDKRMIRLYIKFIDMQLSPQEYYEELFNQGIGTMVADLYICWAYYYDLIGNFQKADTIFRKGIEAKAQPFDELDMAHKHFGFTMSQRILHKDEESQQGFISLLQQRRQALTSLRGGHKKNVGSIRTGAAVKSYNPGIVQSEFLEPSCSNLRVAVFEDQNRDPNTVPEAIKDEEVHSSCYMHHQSVVRSIIDSARKQENLREPGPWSKVKTSDKSKGGLFSTAFNHHKLEFAILEDDSADNLRPLSQGPDNYSKGVQLDANHVTKSLQQSVWKVPIVIEPDIPANAFPCYDKIRLYPRENLSFSPDELRGYLWFKQRDCKNNFTEQHDVVWSNEFSTGARLYLNFSSRNTPQEMFDVERFVSDENITTGKARFVFNVEEVYPCNLKEEFQFEEIMFKKWKSGHRKIKFNGNETVIMEQDIDETKCIIDYKINQRKSIFPNRKSMTNPSFPPRKSIMPIISTRPLVEETKSVNDEMKNLSVRKNVMVGAGMSSQVIPLQLTSQLIPSKKDIGENSSSLGIDEQFKVYQEHETEYIFKVPASIKNLEPFQIFEDEEVNDDEIAVAGQPQPGFAANETCSTQTFNMYLKSQFVSTPKNMKKCGIPRPVNIPEVPKMLQLSPSFGSPAELESELPITSTTLPKQLSTIMETTEMNTGTSTVSASTKSSVDTQLSSPDNDFEGIKIPNIMKELTTIVEKLQEPFVEVPQSLTDFNKDECITVQHKEDTVPSMIISMKVFEEKTETVPNGILTNQPLKFDNNDLYNLFETTPKKKTTHNIKSLTKNDSLTFPEINDFSILTSASQNLQITSNKITLSDSQKNSFNAIVATQNLNSSKLTKENISILPEFMPNEIEFENENNNLPTCVDPTVEILHPKLNLSSKRANDAVFFEQVQQTEKITLINKSVDDDDINTPLKCPDFSEDNVSSDNLISSFSGTGNTTRCANQSNFCYSALREKSLHIKEELGESGAASMFLGNEHTLMNIENHRRSLFHKLPEISKQKMGNFEMDECGNLENNLTINFSQENQKHVLPSHNQISIQSVTIPNAAFAQPYVSASEANTSTLNSEFIEDELGRSIYVTQKTPFMPRCDWDKDSNSDVEIPHTSHDYVYEEVDLNKTKVLIYNHTVDNNFNPFDPELIKAFLDKVDFVRYIEKLDTCSMTSRISQIKGGSVFTIKDKKFHILKIIGEGAYGTVLSGKCSKTGKMFAFKQEKPANLWEYYICLELRSRLVSNDIVCGFMDIKYACIANNASVFVYNYSNFGSLISVCNKFKKATGRNIDEFVVMFLASQMLSIMDHLHASSIIHADVKSDNFLLINKIAFGERKPVIQLIDFGVAIDMNLFPPNQEFTYKCQSSDVLCTEMLDNKPWTYQVDLFGLAGTIHTLLFGAYMDVEKKITSWNIKARMPRYFKKTIWSTIFFDLLNVKDCFTMPNLQSLKTLLDTEIVENENMVKDKIREFNTAMSSD